MRQYLVWAAMLLAGVLTGCGEDNTPMGAVQGYATATGKGDIDKAMSYFVLGPDNNGQLRKAIEYQHTLGLSEAEIVSGGVSPGPVGDTGHVEAIFVFRGTKKRFGCFTKFHQKRWKILVCNQLA